MKILQEGDREYALAPERGRVEVVYEYRSIQLEKTGIKVKNVLVGVDVATGEVLTIPAQSTPKLKTARDSRKAIVMSVRVPRELDDVLGLVSEHYGSESAQFAPALIRYYLTAAASNAGLARRLSELSKSRLAQGKANGNLRLRVRKELHESVHEIASRFEGVNKSDLIRGAILAAKEDVLEGRARRREKELEAVASAV